MSLVLHPWHISGVAALVFATTLFSLEIWPFASFMRSAIRKKKPAKKKQEIQTLNSQLANRITAVLHNVIQVPFALYVLTDPTVSGDHLYGSTTTSTICLSITVGYFIVDAAVCIWHYRTEGPLFLFHALSTLALYTYAMMTGHLHYYGAGFLMWELSTPFVHASWVMHHFDMHDSKVYTINGVLAMATFFLARCVYGIYLSMDYWKESEYELSRPRSAGMSETVIWFVRIANICLNCLNLSWMFKMLQKATSVLGNSTTKQKNR